MTNKFKIGDKVVCVEVFDSIQPVQVSQPKPINDLLSTLLDSVSGNCYMGKDWEIDAVLKLREFSPPDYEALSQSEQVLNMVWIPVSERLPLEHAGVLISFLDQYQYPQIADGYYFKLSNGNLIWHQNADHCEAQGGWEGAIINYEKLNVTHWMNFPAAPKGEE